jgi:hypothetical protein
MKDFVVLFDPKGTRVIKDFDISTYRNNPNALINPNLDTVRGIPLHLWKKGPNNTVVGKGLFPRRQAFYRKYSQYLIPVAFVLGALCSMLLKLR